MTVEIEGHGRSEMGEDHLAISTETEEISELKQKLHGNLEELCAVYGWSRNKKPQTITVLKYLSTIECERRLKHVLQTHQDGEEAKHFDSLYREKSSYAVSRILDHLKSRLREESYSVALSTENRAKFSIADVSIETGNPCKILLNGVETIRLEVKASLGLGLEQLARYLMDNSTLIVARVVTCHAIKLKPSELEDFVAFSIKEMISKSNRLLLDEDGEEYTIPGIYCASCPVSSCKFNRNDGSKRASSSIVKMNNESMQADMVEYFGNLAEVSRKVADLVIQELRSREGGSTKLVAEVKHE